MLILRWRSPAVLLAALLLLAAACGDDDDGESTTPAAADGAAAPTADDLDGRSFEATEATGHELVEGSTVRVSFEGDNVSAIAGCNTMTGAYSIEDGRLVVGELAQTMMACDDALTAQDEWLSTLLTGSPTIELDGDALVLSGDEGTIRATEDA